MTTGTPATSSIRPMYAATPAGRSPNDDTPSSGSDQPGTMPAISIAEPLSAPVPAEMPVEEAIALFDAGGPTVAVVADAAGRPMGVVAVGDLVRAAQLARHANST